MKIVIFGLAITSSWGNGHATTYRSLCSALRRRGHEIVFFEHDTEWYRGNRDLPKPEFCRVKIFDDWWQVLPAARAELRDADVAVVGSYFPDGIPALDEVLSSNVAVKTFYDIDTPITLKELELCGRTGYLLPEHMPELDVYFSFTGGSALETLEIRYGVPAAEPLYCSVDPLKYYERTRTAEFECALSYMGTWAPDRQPKVDEFLCQPASLLPQEKFIVAGPQYPASVDWPANVKRIIHLNPRHHADLYCSSRMVLNVTRRDMVMAGFSPSVRLFEAAACGAAILSDNWPGLETFFTPGEEILLPLSAEDVIRCLRDYDEDELRRIGRAARDRVLGEHTSEIRATEFEHAVGVLSH
ncbi:MAG TPA: glycosyltransferase [Candidatus Angelobacter sp.]|nr:glycosyltransferase [Candidatus Angelobacter sp.]